MTYKLPNHMKYDDLKPHERDYFVAMAKQEANKLLSRVSGSEDFKKLVAANLSQIATPPKTTPPQPGQVTTQGPTQSDRQSTTQEYQDYVNSTPSDDASVPRRSIFGGDQQ